MKYEQPDLLEKFIQNERRSKLWTLLGMIAFCSVSFTVVYVAKSVAPAAAQAPGTQPAIKKDTVIKYETVNKEVPVTVNDPKEAQRIRDSFRRVIAAQPKPIDYSGPYTEATADYKREKERADGLQTQLDDCKGRLNSKPATDDCQKEKKRADDLQDQLNDCLSKVNPKPPINTTQKITLYITTNYPIPDTTMRNLKNAFKLKGYSFSFIPMQTEKRDKAHFRYYNVEDEQMANYILNEIIKSGKFRFGNSIGRPVLDNSAGKASGQFDLYVPNLY